MQSSDVRVSSSVTDKTIQLFLSGINCPRSLAVWLLYRYKEHDQLVALTFRPEDYTSPADAKDAYLSTELLRKADFLSLSVDPKKVAMAKFLESEELCQRTNAKFRHYRMVGSPTWEWLLNRAASHTRYLLNGSYDFDAPSTFDAQEWFRSCNWGPGTNYSLRGKRTSPAYKFQSQTGITSTLYYNVREAFALAYPLWDMHLRQVSPSWGASIACCMADGTTLRHEQDDSIYQDAITCRLEYLQTVLDSTEDGCVFLDAATSYMSLVDAYGVREPRGLDSFEKGNRLLTVPKNAKTDRVIAVEPALNSWFQLGLGEMIRRRLLRYGGIDLRQQDRNQLLAFYGSYTGNLATVDFSSASDTISIEVVRELLPLEWFRMLDMCRSMYGRRPDTEDEQWMKYEKFSSMGNGFTFPLQSLIFTAAAIACCEYLNVDSKYVGVYGDDVVIPSEVFGLYSEFCDFLGFKVGQEKSFSSGFFRESCGAHYLSGVDLKPIYIRRRFGCNGDKYVFANNLRRLAHRGMYYGCHRRFYNCWRYVVRQVPKERRFFIPDGVGDGGFVGNFDEAQPHSIRQPQIRLESGQKLQLNWVEGYQVKMEVQQPIEDWVSFPGLGLGRSFDVDRRHFSADVGTSPYSEDLSGGGNNVPRRLSTRPVAKWVDVPRTWYNFGPWLS